MVNKNEQHKSAPLIQQYNPKSQDDQNVQQPGMYPQINELNSNNIGKIAAKSDLPERAQLRRPHSYNPQYEQKPPVADQQPVYPVQYEPGYNPPALDPYIGDVYEGEG
eukprot:UN24676